MNSGNVRTIESADQAVLAQASDLDAVVSDLSEAFAAYSLLRWNFRDSGGDDPAARLELFDILVRRIGFPAGITYRPARGGAAAIWVPSEKLAALSLRDELKLIPVAVRAAGFRRLPRMLAAEAALDRHHPKDRPHVYLYLLGVHPSLQEMGVGSRLLKADLDRIDQKGLGTFLETNESNVPYYRRFGFEPAESYTAARRCPALFAMWRPPARPH